MSSKFSNCVYVIGTGSPELADYNPTTKQLYKNVSGFFSHQPTPGLGGFHEHESQAASDIVQVWGDAEIHHIRALDSDGSGDLRWYRDALLKCLDLGGNAIISSSLGVTLPDGVDLDEAAIGSLGIATLNDLSRRFVNALDLHSKYYVPVIDEIEAISKELRAKGCILVAASGNESMTTPAYPASSPHQLAIGSEQNGLMSDFSNKGCDFSTDGEDQPLYGWQQVSYGSGTSFSAPDVAGIFGRILQDTNWTQDQLVAACAMMARHKRAPSKAVAYYDKTSGWGSLSWLWDRFKTQDFYKHSAV